MRQSGLEERLLGKSGMKVKRLGFGGIPIQRLSEKEAISLVQKCYKLGINFFDTARIYTTSEERIGKALKEVRKEVFIATKTVKRTKEGLLEDLETSLQKLQIKWIDLYQLHMISKKDEWEYVSQTGGALEGLYEAKDEGKIKHIGITSHNPDLMIDIVKEEIFETVMVPFNYLTPEPAKKLLPLCRENGVGTIAMKPMGGGALSSKESALRYTLENNDVDVAIPGVMNVDEVIKNVGVSSQKTALCEEDLETIENDKVVLGNQYCRACDYCKPCPQDIPISFVLRAEDQLIRLLGWNKEFNEQILEAENRVTACIKCGECENRCPYRLPIRELLPKKMESLMRRYRSEL